MFVFLSKKLFPGYYVIYVRYVNGA